MQRGDARVEGRSRIPRSHLCPLSAPPESNVKQQLPPASHLTSTSGSRFSCLILTFVRHSVLSLLDSFLCLTPPFPSSFFLLLHVLIAPWGRPFVLFIRCSIRVDLSSPAPPLPSLPSFCSARPQMSPFRKQYITPSIHGSLLATRHSQPESPLTTPR